MSRETFDSIVDNVVDQIMDDEKWYNEVKTEYEVQVDMGWYEGTLEDYIRDLAEDLVMNKE